MQVPKIDLIPLRAAICSDVPSDLDVLIRIIPPAPENDLQRPPLNLCLVIDRSSSMKGRKIDYVKKAACYAIQQLLITDRVSVVVFDRAVCTLVDSTFALDKANIIHQIQQIQPGYGTALHAGWQAGAIQVIKHLNSQHLNRVILLSDGFSSVGENNPYVIATDVYGLAQHGVSTTTMGVGNHYDEDLLTSMGKRGNGGYYYIQSPEKLPIIFRTELQDLMATVGHTVSLAIDPQGAVEIEDVLNDLETDQRGRFQLPNLIMGNPMEVVVKLQVPPVPQTTDLCYFRLNWRNPKEEELQKVWTSLRLPVINSASISEFPPHLEVQQRTLLMMVARAKKEAVRHLDRGDYDKASKLLKNARLQVLNAPQSPLLDKEAQALANLDADLQARQLLKLRKQASLETYDITLTNPRILDDIF